VITAWTGDSMVSLDSSLPQPDLAPGKQKRAIRSRVKDLLNNCNMGAPGMGS